MGVWTTNYTKIKELQEDIQYNYAFNTANGSSVTLYPTKFATVTQYTGNTLYLNNYSSSYTPTGGTTSYSCCPPSGISSIIYRCWVPYFQMYHSSEYSSRVHNDGGSWYYWLNCICVGSGTTAPTVDDIDLENRLPWTGSTAASYQQGLFYSCYFNSAKKCVCRFTNTSDSEITVGEVGIFGATCNASSTTSTIGDGILLYRDTFTPITLNRGDFVEFVISFDGYREG